MPCVFHDFCASYVKIHIVPALRRIDLLRFHVQHLLLLPRLRVIIHALQKQRVWNSGTRYEGQWVEDKMHGNGMLQNREGAKYEGAFYNGLRYCCD